MMKEKAWKYSPVLFVVVVACFFLPFVNIKERQVKPAGRVVASFTGWGMISGFEIPETGASADSGPSAQRGAGIAASPAQGNGGRAGFRPLAVLMLSFCVAGGLSALAGRRELAVIPTVCAGSALVTQLMIKSKIDADVLANAGGMLKAGYSHGFWLILAGLALAMFLNAWIFRTHEEGDHEDEWHGEDDFAQVRRTGADEEW